MKQILLNHNCYQQYYLFYCVNKFDVPCVCKCCGNGIGFTEPIYSMCRATPTASNGIHWVDLVSAALYESFKHLKQFCRLIAVLASATLEKHQKNRYSSELNIIVN
jgi:hypothetical protein